MSDGPSNIGRYAVAGELGRGAMGIVYRATDPRIGRVVALKTLLPLPGLDPAMAAQLKERFLNEGRAAGRLDHPGIVTVHDADEDPATGIAYLVMELVEGTDLRALVPGLSPEKLIAILQQVASALDHAHERGVVHRDVKPANVLVDVRGRAQLSDFGIARLGDSTMTQTGQFLGSPAYMSPEQVRGQPVTPATDIFSLGVILYEGLTGKKPFEGDSLVSTAHAIANDDPVRPSELQPSLGPELDQVMRKALAKAPEDRHSTAEALIREAAHALREQHEDTTATVAGTRPGLLPAAVRPRWMLPTAAAVGVAALIVASLTLLPSEEGNADEPEGLAPVRPAIVIAAAASPATQSSVTVAAPTTTTTTAAPRKPAPAKPAPAAPARTQAPAPARASSRLSVELHSGHAGTLVVRAGGREIGRLGAYRESRGKGKGRMKVMRDPVVERSAAWPLPSGKVSLTFTFHQKEGKSITTDSVLSARAGTTHEARVYVGPLGKDLDVRWE